MISTNWHSPYGPFAIIGCLCAGLVTATGSTPGPAAVRDQGAPETSFRLALPGYRYTFPRDHGSHDEFRTEWWYYTGHVMSDEGRRFGYQLTFFRRGVQPKDRSPGSSRWSIRHLYLAHFALTDVEAGRFQYEEKVSRAGLGKAGADSDRLHTWIDRWAVEMGAQDDTTHHLQAFSPHASIDLRLTTDKPLIVHGHHGISLKGGTPGQASHYYSLTRLATTGTITVNGRSMPVTGLSWMDHEFGSADLGKDMVGWDWFSIQLTDHSELMFYLLRRADGSPAAASSGTFVTPSGNGHHLSRQDVQFHILDHWVSEASGARYPSRWRISVPRFGLAIEVTPLLANQELRTGKSTQVTYWEGAVEVTGKRESTRVEGQGYVELTGYAKRFDQPL